MTSNLEETTSELMAEILHQSDKIERLQAQLKAKDELIELCREENTNLSAKCWGYVKKLKAKDAKARSIVAMLFWEWRKAEKLYQDEWNIDNKRMSLALFAIQSSTSEQLFKQAYKILKDNQ